MTTAHPFSFFPSFLVTETWFCAQRKCLHFYTLLYRHSPCLLQASRDLLVASSFLTVHGMGVLAVVTQESCGITEAQHPAKEDNREKKRRTNLRTPNYLSLNFFHVGEK